MDNEQRQRRLRLLIRRLNKERKKQAQKIDILCYDFISAQAEFIKRLSTINFTVHFYEASLAATDLNSLLYTAAKIIKDEIADSNVTLFLLANDSFELYMFDSDKPITLEKQHLENCFTAELVDNVCKANKLCTLDDMFAMGLQDNLVRLSKISAVTVPLCRLGSSLGFILIYRLSGQKLTHDELRNITAVTCGLSRAIQSCQTTLQSAD
jgi:transcriptional regulator with GAF, ATPase, and Fis domain